MKVKYNIIINKIKEKKRIDNLEACFRKDILFPNMIKKILKENRIKSEFVHVNKLMHNTWGKIFSEDLMFYMDGRDYYYEWLNYKIGDIQEKFHLFDDIIDIVCDDGGYGGYMGGTEGIKFIIHSNEKDRHRNEPHVHCEYAGEKMRIRIDTLHIMGNDKAFKSNTKTKKAIKWIQKNQEDLLKYYNNFAVDGNNIELKIGR